MKRIIHMMTGILLTAAVMATKSANAATDSVGVFHRAEKVVVLINERGSHSRLQDFMNHLEAGERIVWQSADESIRIQCARNMTDASCTFLFLPSSDVQIGEKEVRATVPSAQQIDFGMSFESSQGDRFELHSNGESYIIWASKKTL